ncbi:MAG: hypothetical protein ACK4NE_07860 [Albidovulum sp.]
MSSDLTALADRVEAAERLPYWRPGTPRHVIEAHELWRQGNEYGEAVAAFLRAKAQEQDHG